ncbi:MAG: phosphoglycerate kinase [Candidatus Liptonbacteria bacterium]
MVIKYLSKISPAKLRGVALVRLDFNAKDGWRMDAALPTMSILRKNARAVLVVSHRGRPKGFDRRLSLRQQAVALSRKMGHPVAFLGKFDFPGIQRIISGAAPGSVFLLENIRFLDSEFTPEPELAKELAGLADYYVNDAFPVNHHRGDSICLIEDYLPSYAGLQLEKEMKSLSGVMKSPRHPLVLIVGGAKTSDKLEVVKNLYDKADAILFGGTAASTILKASGIDVGRSLVDERADMKYLARLAKSKKVFLPVDWAKEKNAIYDIGPKTEELYAQKIKSARTIVWSGPMGLIEKEKFSLGNLAVAEAIANNKKAFSITGGGETVSFLKEHKLDKKFGFISTGGGAMLDYLAGEKLPGIEALKRSK